MRLSLNDKGMKYYRLYLDVVRRPKNEFKNLNWEPPRGKYAFVSFLKQGRVLRRFALESLQEEIQFIPDAVGQAQLMLKCLLDTSNQTAVNLGLALGAVPIEVTNPIAEFGELDIGWDEARIVCYADTAVEIALYGQKYDVCEESDERPEPGGPPVPIPPPVPPGTPIEDISEPYDQETDDGLTVPNPLDDLPDEPPVPCVTVIRGAGLNEITCGALGNFGDYSYQGYAQLVPVNVPPNNCPGLRVFLDGVDLGFEQTYHPSAVILSRSGDCEPP